MAPMFLDMAAKGPGAERIKADGHSFVVPWEAPWHLNQLKEMMLCIQVSAPSS